MLGASPGQPTLVFGHHPEYLGLYPAYTLGSRADRNRVVARDFSALSPVPSRLR